ncbi:GNAT family N-acetyltransferase [Burkholderia contaminans]|nr:GNAT family N-acetyltransferase [Burkholderia contaminans]
MDAGVGWGGWGRWWRVRGRGGWSVCEVYRRTHAQGMGLEEEEGARWHAGQRIGARLIEQVTARAAQEGIAEIVLSTFRDAPWNAPYYARLGFSIVDGATLDEMLREIRANHVALGLDETQRVFMRADVRR